MITEMTDLTPPARKERNFTLLTTSQAAKILGFKKRTLDNMRLISCGPPYYRISKRTIRYHEEDVIEYRDSKRIVPVDN